MTTTTTAQPIHAISQAATPAQITRRVRQLTADINAGTVNHLDLLPEWCHDAIECWTERKPGFTIAQVDAAVRVFYAVDKAARTAGL